jgi:hypothetical protein
MAYIIKNIWEEHIKGYYFTDCAIRDKNIVYICMRENIPPEKASLMWDHDIRTKHFVVYLDTPNDSFGFCFLEGYNKPIIGIALKPRSQGLLVARNRDGQVKETLNKQSNGGKLDKGRGEK